MRRARKYYAAFGKLRHFSALPADKPRFASRFPRYSMPTGCAASPAFTRNIGERRRAAVGQPALAQSCSVPSSRVRSRAALPAQCESCRTVVAGAQLCRTFVAIASVADKQEERGFEYAEHDPRNEAAGMRDIMQQIVRVRQKRHRARTAVEAHSEIDKAEHDRARDHVERVPPRLACEHENIIDDDIAVKPVIDAGKSPRRQREIISRRRERRKQRHRKNEQQHSETALLAFDIYPGDGKAQHIEQTMLPVRVHIRPRKRDEQIFERERIPLRTFVRRRRPLRQRVTDDIEYHDRQRHDEKPIHIDERDFPAPVVQNDVVLYVYHCSPPIPFSSGGIPPNAFLVAAPRACRGGSCSCC